MFEDFGFDFHKRGRMNSDLEFDDLGEASTTALAYIESLAFVLGNLDTQDLQEADGESLRVYLHGTTELIIGMVTSLAGFVDSLDGRRKDLQRLADFMAKTSSKEEIERLIEKLKEKK